MHKLLYYIYLIYGQSTYSIEIEDLSWIVNKVKERRK